MESIVAFADILGTTEKVQNGSFSDYLSLDFANPVGIAAQHNRKLRFSVFSDSVIVSSPVDELDRFSSVMSFLYSQWFSDAILVRCGVSVGEINWVDDSNTDDSFRRLRNLSYSRVYGAALVRAHAIEQRSGPGAICFLDDSVSAILMDANPCYVLEGAMDSLIWESEKGIDYWLDVINMWFAREKTGSQAKRHLKATLDYFRRFKDSEKSVPENFLYATMQ